MTSSDANKGRTAPKDTSFAATSLIDPNAALWASIRPARDASFSANLQEVFGALWASVTGQRTAPGFPAAFLEPAGSSRWVLAGLVGVCIGAGLSVYGSLGSSSAARGPQAHALPGVQALATSRASSAGAAAQPPSLAPRAPLVALQPTPSSEAAGSSRGLNAALGASAPAAYEETLARSLEPSESRVGQRSKAKSKGAGASKRKAKSTARRLLEARRARRSVSSR
jgi:hypothetical protein